MLTFDIFEAFFAASFTFLAKRFNLPGLRVSRFRFPVTKLLVCCSFSFLNLALALALRWSRSVVHDRGRSRSAIPASARVVHSVFRSSKLRLVSRASSCSLSAPLPSGVGCCTSLLGLLRLGLRIPSLASAFSSKDFRASFCSSCRTSCGGPSSSLESAPLRAAISSSFFVDALAVMP
jgi:hypothetical protein